MHWKKNTSVGLAALAASVSLSCVASAAPAEMQKIAFAIPAQDLGEALGDFIHQSRQQLLFSPELVQGRTARALNGVYAPEQGLRQLLSGTGLAMRATGGGAFVLVATQSQAVQGHAASAAAPAITGAASMGNGEAPTALGEIIVTARKRQESILNVPVIETAIPQAQLERFQTQDLSDVATLVPGLSLGAQVLAIGTQVSIRGVGTSTLDPGVDQSVSLNIDGLQLTQGLAYASGMFDLAQIEVLKGPQALFYGKNSPGGVISLRTADPGDRFEVIARGGHEFVANENRGEVIVSGPVTDTLGLRLASMYDTSDGYFTNAAIADPHTGALPPTSRSNPPSKSYMVRGTAVWRPTDAFSARLKANVVHDRVTESGSQLVSCPDGLGAPRGIPFIGGNENCQKDRTLNIVNMDPTAFLGVINNGVPFTDTAQQYGTLELAYTTPSKLTFTSTTGFYHIHSDALINGSGSTFAGPTLAAENFYRRRDFTEELRVNSDFASPVNFTAGAFYQDAFVHYTSTLLGNTTYHLPTFLSNSNHNLGINFYSAFGQLRWEVLPRLEVSSGLRWTSEKRSDTPFNLLTGTPVYVPIAVPSIKSDNVSPELTITWRPTDDLTLFGSLKKGYKSGSFTLSRPATAGGDNSFGDEKVEGGEVGLKSRWLDRQLAVNLAFYDYRYLGLQVGANEPAVNGLPLERTINAGAALVYGVDFDAAYRPEMVEGLNLHTSVEWNQAHFKTLDNVPCWGGQTIAAGCNQFLNPQTGLYTSQNLAGQPLVRAPAWQVNFGLDYEVPLGHDLKLVVSNNNQYSSKYLTALGLRPDFYQPAFITADLSLTLQGPRDRWEVAVIGKNLNDALSAGSCSSANFANGAILGGQITGGTGRGPAGVDEVSCFLNRGREVWLRLTLKPFN